ncbi:MAG TPA: hypothetical protein VFL91_26900 [Thermomicrobiales bacterium]|nr:hypothetical protein [Thermomicrobiales bacterium]
MSNQQPTSGTVDADTGGRAEVQGNQTTTRGLAGTRRFAGLALAAALLLALGFATGRTSDRLWPVNTAGGAPAAPRQPLAADGYAPTRLDYREDHRAAAPAYGVDTVGYPPTFGPGSLDYRTAPAYGADRMNYREDHRLDPRPATLPDTPRQQQRPAWLDARDYGPADNGAPPPQDDGHNRGPR